MARLGVKTNSAWWLGTPAVRPSSRIPLVVRGFDLGRYIIDMNPVEKMVYTEINGVKTGWAYRLGKFKTVEFWTDRLLLTMTIEPLLYKGISVVINGREYTRHERLPMCIDPEWFRYRTWAGLTGNDSRQWLLKLTARNRSEFERLVPVVYRDSPGDYYCYILQLDKTNPERMRVASAFFHDLVYV